MPEMSLGDSAGHLSQNDAFKVVAYMAHPRDQKLRLEYLARIAEQVVASMQPLMEERYPADKASAILGAQLGRWLQPLGGFPRLTASPSADLTVNRIVESGWPGSIAGDILIYIERMRASGIAPSVKKAVAVTVKFLENSATAAGAPGAGGSLRYVEERWSDFRPVAHLWAAFRATFLTNRGGGNFPTLRDKDGPFFFLALSEWFAEVGLSVYPHGQKQPILDSSELWRVPAGVKAQLPALQLQSEPLPGWALEVLRKYRYKKSY